MFKKKTETKPWEVAAIQYLCLILNIFQTF